MDNKDKPQKTAFVASEELTEKIKKIQKLLNLKTPGEVISMGLSLIELSMGREVEFKEGSKTYKTNKFAKFNQTVVIDDGTDK